MIDSASGPRVMARPQAYSLVGIAILALSWVQFTGAWWWPPIRNVEWGVIELQPDKPGGVLLQYPLWLLIIAGVGLAVYEDGMTFVRRFLPFTILMCIMLTASVFGMSLGSSSRITVLWLLSAVAGAAVATLLDRDTVITGLVAVIAVTMLASLLSYLLLPEYGADRYYARIVLRGVFMHKNTAGRVAALALTLIVVMRGELPRALLLTGLVATALCLFLSESKTAWLSAVLGIGFVGLIEVLRRRLTAALAILVIGAIAFLTILLVMTFAPILAEALGRDLTLTGRTTVWQAYLGEIRHVFWLGAGPGNLTAVSPLTAKLALVLRAHGSIFSPHSFYIGTLGDLGIVGLLYTMLLFAYLSLWLPLSERGTLALGCAAVGTSTLVGGLGETLDAAAPGSTWFLLALFWMGHCRHRSAASRPTAHDAVAEVVPASSAMGHPSN